jgi:hypothetical protein
MLHGFMHNLQGLKHAQEDKKNRPWTELDGRVFSVLPKKGSEKETRGNQAGPENMCKKTRKTGVGESLVVGTQSPGTQTVQKGWATKEERD